MPETIISDTSCFIILANIGELELLKKVYGNILTTSKVLSEFGETLPEWIEIRDASDKYRQQVLEMQVDKGEASAFALALETPNSTVIVDDFRARVVADRLGLKYTGTVGVIIKAKVEGKIESIKPLLLKIRLTNFRITDQIEKQALFEAGE